jgi:hypothetical protein
MHELLASPQPLLRFSVGCNPAAGRSTLLHTLPATPPPPTSAAPTFLELLWRQHVAPLGLGGHLGIGRLEQRDVGRPAGVVLQALYHGGHLAGPPLEVHQAQLPLEAAASVPASRAAKWCEWSLTLS